MALLFARERIVVGFWCTFTVHGLFTIPYFENSQRTKIPAIAS